jgi:hypothetical protein
VKALLIGNVLLLPYLHNRWRHCIGGIGSCVHCELLTRSFLHEEQKIVIIFERICLVDVAHLCALKGKVVMLFQSASSYANGGAGQYKGHLAEMGMVSDSLHRNVACLSCLVESLLGYTCRCYFTDSVNS